MKFEIEIRPGTRDPELFGQLIEPSRPGSELYISRPVPVVDVLNAWKNSDQLMLDAIHTLAADLYVTGALIEREGWAEYDRRTKS